MALSSFHWQPQTLAIKVSPPWMFVLLTTASLAMHGLLLGLPLPSTEEAEGSPSVPPPTATAAMEVTVLPKDFFQPAVPETEAAAPSPSEPPAEAVARSQSAPLPQTVPPVPLPEQPTPPQPPSTADDPAPVAPVPSDSVNDLPTEPGTTPLTVPEPPRPPSLEERLQDPTAYQFDGKQVLDFGAVTSKLLGWVTPGQTLPSKADPLEVPYLLAGHCLAEPPVSGVMVVVLDTDNTILQGPEVISSTGYTILDEKAKEDVRTGQYTFPARDQAKAYSLEITVSYPPDCPD